MSTAQRRALDEQLRSAPQPAGPVSVDQMRAGFAHFMSTFPIPDDVTQTTTEVGGRPAVLVEPNGSARRAGTILYFHGGSFSLGSPATAMALTGHLVRQSGVRAVSVDYRLAPEHPFPAAIDDCLAAYRALIDSGSRLSLGCLRRGLGWRWARGHDNDRGA